MKKFALLIACLWLGLTAASYAAQAPDQLVRETTDELLAEFTENRKALEKDKERLYDLVNEIVVPNFDMQRMARYVLGQHWGEATDEEKEKFITEFKTQLVRTYATALFEYTGDLEIQYKPFRHEEGDKRAVVKTEVPRDDGPSVPVEYRMILNDDQWQVYDVVIENISTVQNYRAQYGAAINSQGISGLIEALREKNERLLKEQ